MGYHEMSQSKVTGSAATVAAATLPVTGNNVVLLVLAGIALVVTGLLLVRSGRYHVGRGLAVGRGLESAEVA
jgi:LPXTG-motif cell wall-anchored protein